jgi:hypothetical protein
VISKKKPAPELLWCDHCRSEVHATILQSCTRAATGRCPAREPMKAHVAHWKAAQADLRRLTETLTDQKGSTRAPAK